MCGIAGIIDYKDGGGDKKALLKRMTDLMHHRGPDSKGFYADGPAGLGHARLSIIDLSGGDQPIHNEEKTVWIVFNGEIFNYPELRAQLIEKGHQFYTKSDTEVIVHLYEEHGDGLFEYLNGQFAFAIWDLKEEKVLLGRDRMGIRPLFYHHQNGRLLFASEIKAVFADKTVPRQVEPQSLSDIFTCWSNFGKETFFKDIFQIPPGHYAWFSKNGLEVNQFWDLPFADNGFSTASEEELAQELGDILLDASRIRLRADVPVGAYLSGGIDSTYITSLVKHNFNNNLCTFSVGFTDADFDESSYQQTAVDWLKTDHKAISCTYEDIGRNFPKVVWHTETPVIRTAPTPLMMLSKLVRQSGFKVVLTGEGADEMFAGYNMFKENKVRRFWAKDPESKMRPRLLEKLYPYIFSQGNAKAIKYLEQFFKKGMGETDSPVYSHMLRWSNTSQLRQFFSDDFRSGITGLDNFVERYTKSLPAGFMKRDPLSRAQYIENKVFMSNYLLSSQGDRMAMASSIEGRYPFLDHRVAAFASKLPPHIRMNGLTEKYILKTAAKGKIPSSLISRNKQPYRAPISQAFLGDTRHDYVQELLGEDALKRYGMFDPKKVERLLKKCLQNKGALLSERENMALVGILSAQLIGFHFIENFSAPA